MINFGAVPAGAVLPVIFDSFDGGTGASMTLTGLAITDVEIYKGVSMTQRASDAGIVLIDTDGIDLDGVTGIHGFSIDTGDNTDASFYAVGSFFTVVVAAVTIDAQTVNFVAATFRIVAAEAVAGKPKVDVDAWLGTAAATPTVAGVPEVDLTHVAGSATSVSTLASSVATLLADWINGGRLDLILDIIAADTTTDLPALISAAAANVSVDEIQPSALADLFNTDSGTTYASAVAGSVVKEMSDSAGDALQTVVDGIWDEPIADHLDAGTTGLALNSRASQTSLDTLDDLVDTEVGAIKTVVDAVKVQTDKLTFTVANQIDSNVLDWKSATAPAMTGDAFARLGVAGAGLTAVPWNAAWDAEVESEVNDAIDTAIAELGVAAPTATPTLRTGMMLMYMALRNKLVVQTSGTDAIEIYNNAGTKIAAKAITDDGSDYTEAEMA
jgi:hypothetical protein